LPDRELNIFALMRQNVAPGTNNYYHRILELAIFCTAGKSSMEEPWANAAQFAGQHYREMANKLRELARQFRFPGARRELLDLALRYERRADHFDARNGATNSGQRSA
jgi:hypothetical protein